MADLADHRRRWHGLRGGGHAHPVAQSLEIRSARGHPVTEHDHRRGQPRRRRPAAAAPGSPIAAPWRAPSTGRGRRTPRPCGRRGACTPAHRRTGRLAASASSVGTAATGSPRANARPLTVAAPTRSPVNEPGPIDTARPCTWPRRPPAILEQPIDHGHEALGVGERDVEEAQPDHAAILAEGNAAGQRRCLEREDPHDARQSNTLGPPVAAARHLSS